jgi:hypothetical protein
VLPGGFLLCIMRVAECQVMTELSEPVCIPLTIHNRMQKIKICKHSEQPNGFTQPRNYFFQLNAYRSLSGPPVHWNSFNIM